MVEGERKNWRELCNAALEASDPDELLKILQELNKALKREEQVRRDFREATTAHKSSVEIRSNTYRKSSDRSGYLKHEGANTNE
jgi:ribosomal protein L16 Arg81 hydroxylase